MYEDIICLKGEQASEALGILNEHGEQAVIDYLAQWHYPGEHMTRDEPGAGRSDTVYTSGDYILTYNQGLEYVGLEYVWR